MTENVITIDPSSKVSEASKLMVGKNVSSLLVVKNKKPIAIINENDVLKSVLSTNKKKVSDFMHKNFKIIDTYARYVDIVKDLREKGIKKFAVVDLDMNLVGFITETDIVKATRDFTRMHQITQEVILAIFGIVTAFFLFFFSPLGTSIFRHKHLQAGIILSKKEFLGFLSWQTSLFSITII